MSIRKPPKSETDWMLQMWRFHFLDGNELREQKDLKTKPWWLYFWWTRSCPFTFLRTACGWGSFPAFWTGFGFWRNIFVHTVFTKSYGTLLVGKYHTRLSVNAGLWVVLDSGWSERRGWTSVSGCFHSSSPAPPSQSQVGWSTSLLVVLDFFFFFKGKICTIFSETRERWWGI